MSFSHFEHQNPQTIAQIFKAIQEIQRLQHDANKPIDKKWLEETALKGGERNKKDTKAQQAQKKLNELKDKIHQEQGDTALRWLTMTVEPIVNDATLPIDLQATVESYGKYFNASLYNELLPYTQLAYIYELNGSAEEHALKLCVLFKDKHAALNFLYKIIGHSSVHDACLFSLPDPNQCSFSIWLLLAKRHIEDHTFRKILGQASEIEKLIRVTCQQRLKNAFDRQAIDTLKASIKTNQARWKKLATHEVLRETHEQEYHMLSNQLVTDRNTLTQAGITFTHQIDLLTLGCYHELYIKKASQAYQYMLSLGLTKKDYEKFINLDRTHAGENIPNVQLDGTELGHPGYYFIKVNAEDEEEAARAACLGKLTNCCQSLSGQLGEPCTIHGLTSPNGGFYILCKGDIKSPKISDTLIAQSWVWRSQTGALVFDSIECGSKLRPLKEITVLFYRYVAKKLCLSDETDKVYCGARSGISSMLSTIDVACIEKFKDYTGYSDSKKQLCIYDKEKPWYFFDSDADAKQKIDFILMSVRSSPKPFIESDAFCEMTNWAIMSSNELVEYIHLNLQDTIADTDKLKLFIDSMNYALSPESDVEKIWEEIQKNTVHINTINNMGQTFLIKAAEQKQLAIFERLISKGINLLKKDHKEKNIVHYLVDQPEYIRLVLESLPVEDRFSTLLAKDDMEQTPIELMKPPCYISVLNALSEKDNVSLITQLDNEGNTMLHRASTYEVVKKILSLHPNPMAAIRQTNKNQETVLHSLAKYPECLKVLVDFVSKETVRELMQCKNFLGQVPLYFAISEVESIRIFRTFYSKDEWVALLKINLFGKFKLIHLVAPYAASLEMVLASYPTTEDALEAITMPLGKDGDSLILYTLANPESVDILVRYLSQSELSNLLKKCTKLVYYNDLASSLKRLLEYIPVEERVEAFQWMANFYLNRILVDYHLFLDMLQLIPQEHWLNVLGLTNALNYTIIKIVAMDPEAIKALFQLLPYPLNFNALTITSPGSNKTLLYSVDKINSISAIIESFPQNRRLDVLKMAEHIGLKTILERNFDTLKTLFNLLLVEQKIEALVIPIGSDLEPNPLILVYSIKDTLALLPKEKWMEMLLKEGDEKHNLVIHYVVKYTPDTLNDVLDLVSHEEKLVLLRAMNSYDLSTFALYCARLKEEMPETYLEKVRTLLESFPELEGDFDKPIFNMHGFFTPLTERSPNQDKTLELNNDESSMVNHKS